MKIRKNICVIIISLFAALCVSACDGTMLDITREALLNFKPCAGIAQWARSVTAGPDSSNFNSVTVGPDGSVYAAGYINLTGEYDFGNEVTAAGKASKNILLVKYRSDGTALWANSVTAGDNFSEFISVTVGPDGSVYAAGYIYGTGSFDFGNSVSVAGKCTTRNVVLVKYNIDGLAQWAKSVTAGTNSSQFYSVAVGSDGSVYAAGYIYLNIEYDFGDDLFHAYVTGNNASGSNIVLVKYNSDGTALWARSAITGPSESLFNSVTVDPEGSVYAAGKILGSDEYGFGNEITVNGGFEFDNSVLVKYDSDGTALWAKSVTTGPAASWFNSVTVDKDGYVYAAGDISGTDPFNFGNLVTAKGDSSSQNIVIVKYNSDGLAQWAKSATTGPAESLFNSVTVGIDGCVYAAGYISGTDQFDLGNLVTVNGSHSGQNIVVVKYNNDGLAQWARSVTSGTNNSFSKSVAGHSDGSVYTAGTIYGTTEYDFGSAVTVSGGDTNQNVVLVKYK